MLNHRFTPYIVVVGLMLLLVAYFMGYQQYQKEVTFERFISDAEAFNRSVVDEDRSEFVENVLSTDRQTGSGHLPAHILVESFSKDNIGQKPVKSGQLIETIPLSQDDMVMQQVRTPDGEIHEVEVLRGWEYQDDNVISRSELNPYEPVSLGIIGVVEVPPGVDPYEYSEQADKIFQARTLGISVEELEQRIAAGEGEALKEEADRLLLSRGLGISMEEVERLTAEGRLYNPGPGEEIPPTQKPAMSDKPIVDVRLLSEGRDAMHGQMPKWAQDYGALLSVGREKGIDSIRDDTAAPSGSSSVQGVDADRGFNETRPIQAAAPRPPSDISSLIASSKPPRSEFGVESPKPSAPLSAEQIESQLKQQLSPEQFGKAQQLIDRYGTEEGLRRLKESDPEAARRFERERRPVPSRDVPDGGQSQSESKD